MILDMDVDKIRFPRISTGSRPPEPDGVPVSGKWGGRGMDWCPPAWSVEEIGVLGYIFACTFGVGAELVCDAIILHGTDAQKEKYVKPLLKGKIFCGGMPDRTPGGSDFSAPPPQPWTKAIILFSTARNGSSWAVKGRIFSRMRKPTRMPSPETVSPVLLWTAPTGWKPNIYTA